MDLDTPTCLANFIEARKATERLDALPVFIPSLLLCCPRLAVFAGPAQDASGPLAR